MKAGGFSFLALLVVGCSSTVSGTGNEEVPDAQASPSPAPPSEDSPKPEERKIAASEPDAGTVEKDAALDAAPDVSPQPPCMSIKIPGPGILTGPTVDLKPAPQASSCIEAWVKMSPTVDWPSIVFSMGENVVNQDSWEIGCASNGHLDFVHYRNSTTQNIEEYGTNCSDGNFHHVAMCFYDLGGGPYVGGELFLDGTSMGTKSMVFDVLTAVLNIGGWPQYPTQAVTVLDEIRVSNSRRYNGAFAPQKHLQVDSNTTFLFHLDEGTGPQVADTKGKTLTLPNVATWSNECP